MFPGRDEDLHAAISWIAYSHLRGFVFTITTRHTQETVKGILYAQKALSMICQQMPAYTDKLQPFLSMRSYHDAFPKNWVAEDP